MYKIKQAISKFLHPIWKLILAGPPFIHGWFALKIDEFLSKEYSEKLRIGWIIVEFTNPIQ
jgi:hypothetical protein